MGGQCDKEVTAFLSHRTAHLMANLSIPEGIKPPLVGRASQGGTALLMQSQSSERARGAGRLLGSTGSRHVGVQVCVCQGWSMWEL